MHVLRTLTVGKCCPRVYYSYKTHIHVEVLHGRGGDGVSTPGEEVRVGLLSLEEKRAAPSCASGGTVEQHTFERQGEDRGSWVLTTRTDVLTTSETLCLSSAAVPGLPSPRVNFLVSG